MPVSYPPALDAGAPDDGDLAPLILTVGPELALQAPPVSRPDDEPSVGPEEPDWRPGLLDDPPRHAKMARE